MQYLNISQVRNGYVRWQLLSEIQRLIIKWSILTVATASIFWFAQSVAPENPTVFRYFLSLYAIDSLVFFLIFKEHLTLGKTMLVFLLTLELIVTVYYFFNYLSAV